MKASLILLAAPLLIANPSFAFSYDSTSRTLPGGVIAPAYNQSISIDPAALPDGHSTALDFEDRPALLDRTDNAFGASIATSSGTAAIGAGYGRTDYGGGLDASNDLYLGAGMGFGAVRLGLGFDLGLNRGSGNSLEAAFLLGASQGSGVRFGGVVTQLNSSPELTVGLGYLDNGRFNIEANFSFPSFASGLFATGSVYRALAAAGFYTGNVGLGLDAAYTQAWGSGYTGSWAFGVSGTWTPSRWPALTVHYTTFRDLTFGVIFTL